LEANGGNGWCCPSDLEFVGLLLYC